LIARRLTTTSDPAVVATIGNPTRSPARGGCRRDERNGDGDADESNNSPEVAMTVLNTRNAICVTGWWKPVAGHVVTACQVGTAGILSPWFRS